MILFTHRIAGIVFRTEMNVRLPIIGAGPLEKFRINDRIPHVKQRIHKIVDGGFSSSSHLTSKSGKPIDFDNLSSLPKSNHAVIEFPLVRDRLNTAMKSAGQMVVGIDDHQAIVKDYKRCELDFFYTEKLWGYNPTRRICMADIRVAADLRHIFNTFMPCFYSLMIHSSGILRGNKVVVFLAPSGGGKTTVVINSKKNLVLSDDQVVLSKEGGLIEAHSSPFGRFTSGPCSGRLSGLFLLEKSDRFRLSPMGSQDMLQCIWSSNPDYFLLFPRELKMRAFGILSDACRQAHTYKMEFPKDHIDWDAIDAAMEGRLE